MNASDWKRLPQAERAARVLPIVQAATHGTNVPAPLVMGLIQQESNFSPWATATDPRDVARGGSYGLMQMSLATARALGYKGVTGDPAQLTGLYDPVTNVSLGVAYLRDLITATRGDTAAAVSGYNAGLSSERQGDGKRTGNDRTAPFINQSYVDAVMTFARQFGALDGALVIVFAVLCALALGGRFNASR